MKAIHGGKKKDDKLDSEKIARRMRGGTFPLSYVYPREMRATRDLVRHLSRRTRDDSKPAAFRPASTSIDYISAEEEHS